MTACLRSQDERTKTFNFYWKVRNDTTAKTGITLSHIQEATNKLKKVQGLFDIISRNIYIKNDIDKELTESKRFIIQYTK